MLTTAPLGPLFPLFQNPVLVPSCPPCLLVLPCSSLSSPSHQCGCSPSLLFSWRFLCFCDLVYTLETDLTQRLIPEQICIWSPESWELSHCCLHSTSPGCFEGTSPRVCPQLPLTFFPAPAPLPGFRFLDLEGQGSVLAFSPPALLSLHPTAFPSVRTVRWLLDSPQHSPLASLQPMPHPQPQCNCKLSLAWPTSRSTHKSVPTT